MIVSFDSEELHNLCWVLEAAEEQLGSSTALALATLIADAEAAENGEELQELHPPMDFHENDDSILIAVDASCRARFVAAGQGFRRNGEGGADWASVRRLKLVALETAT